METCLLAGGQIPTPLACFPYTVDVLFVRCSLIVDACAHGYDVGATNTEMDARRKSRWLLYDL